MFAFQLFDKSKVLWPAICKITRMLHRKGETLPKGAAKEIEIEVPWGKVAGALWGQEEDHPILAIHGWQDNAGSFDTLAPLLSSHASILAIDLPGHGLSSWLPPGMMYQEFIYIMLIQRIKKHFGWKSVKLLSHSLGAQISFWYASLYPNETKFVIALDHLKLPSVAVSNYNKIITVAISKFFKIEESRDSTRGYSEVEIIKKWIEATQNSIDEAACRRLMIRGSTRRTDGTIMLNRDPRVKVLPVHTLLPHAYLQELAKLITCPYIFLQAENSFVFEDRKYLEDILQIMKGSCKDIQLRTVPGTHHFHLRNAEAAADVIKPFLVKYN